jgi:probable HAF family extracellular repeat protein
MTDLGTLHGDPCSVAESVNLSGQVVGASQSSAGGCDFYTSAILWENGGPSVDLNTLVPPGSMLLLGATWINDRGEITGRGAPIGCGDGDTCGHAFLLIPCDQNHLDLESCDYNLVDTSTVAEAGRAETPGYSSATTESGRMPGVLRDRLRRRIAGWQSNSGAPRGMK